MKVQAREGFGIVSKSIAKNPDLSPRAKGLYLLLACYADGGSRECWPRRSTLAADMGWSVDTLDRVMGELVSAEVVVRVPRHREDGGYRSFLTRLRDFVVVYSPDLPEGP